MKPILAFRSWIFAVVGFVAVVSAAVAQVPAPGSSRQSRPAHLAVPGSKPETIRPNFVVILVDDLGWRDLGIGGGQLYETPNIDRFARSAVRFTQAYSACTVCSPTRAALLTGQYPARLHITDWIAGHVRPKARLRVPDWTMELPAETTTIAEVLKGVGYSTALIGKWHLGGTNSTPEDHGFDLNVGGTDKGQPPSYFSPYRIPTLKDGPVGEYLADRETDEAVKFIQAHTNRPFFLYLPRYSVHTPLQAKAEKIAKYREKLAKVGGIHTNPAYAAMIESLDEGVGRILETLEELKLGDRTVVVFTSDNGGLIPVTSNLPLRDGKGSAYEAGIRVPLFIRWPGHSRTNTTVTAPVITQDLFHTFAEMAGAPLPPKLPRDGTSLTASLEKGLDPRRDSIYWHYPHYHPGGATPYSAVRRGKWKLIEFLEDHHVELYDLEADPGERKDVAPLMPHVRDTLKRSLEAWRDQVGAQMPTANPGYDPDSEAPKEARKKAKKP